MRAEAREKYLRQPQIPTELTSSVGALWPPEPSSFGRIKGIYTAGIVSTDQDLGEILGAIGHAQSVHFSDLSSDIRRVSIRAIMDADYIRSLGDQEASLIEAVIPLRGTQGVFENSAMVYFGANHPNRQSLDEEVASYQDNLRSALLVELRDPKQVIERVKSNGFAVGIINFPEDGPRREFIIDQVSSLYARFGWSRDEVVSILTNPANLISCAVKDDVIVSSCVAEMAAIPVGYKTLRVVEITEAATRNEYERNGLYSAVSATLLQELASLSSRESVLSGEIDFVYGECNGNAPGVLRTAKMQGRIFSAENGVVYGLPDSGMLHQHVPISGLPRSTPYNDLFPAYLTKEQLYSRYLV